MRNICIVLIISSFVLVGCNSNKIVNIEDDNNYLWQKYMNESEFNELKKGYSYMKVVEIAGGEGELVKQQKKREEYLWPDEILMTQSYLITFEKNKLVKKEKVERSGNSKRGSEMQ